MTQADADVVIVGGGPAGLAAAIELRRLGVNRVAVLEREKELGGIPRHCHHVGFGLRDLRRVLSGPSYARRRAELARRAGAELYTETSAVDWAGQLSLRTTSPRGTRDVSAGTILLATGCRERPRAARLVPGSRPLGIFTTGSLQQLVHLHRERAGRRAVVVGAEHVSFSAVHSLVTSGTEVLAMVTDLPSHQSYAALGWLIASRHRIPILASSEITQIAGRRRVEAVEIGSCGKDSRRWVECDTVVFTGDWIPDHELARVGGVAIDPGTRGPAVDVTLRTSLPGVFAAGNALRGAETADVAALEGRRAARSIGRFLTDGGWPAAASGLSLCVEPPVKWICPNVLAPGEQSGHVPSFVLRVSEFLQSASIEVRQGGRRLHAQRFAWMVPNRSIGIDGAWVSKVVLGAEPVVIGASR